MITPRPTLMDKLGGLETLQAAVAEMYTRLSNDPRTSHFFQDLQAVFLKQHQIAFMRVAFAVTPEHLDLPKWMMDKHAYLFAEPGLNERHFDVMLQHLVGAMERLQIGKQLRDEAVATMKPLRVLFETGAAVASSPPRSKMSRSPAAADHEATVAVLTHPNRWGDASVSSKEPRAPCR